MSPMFLIAAIHVIGAFVIAYSLNPRVNPPVPGAAPGPHIALAPRVGLGWIFAAFFFAVGVVVPNATPGGGWPVDPAGSGSTASYGAAATVLSAGQSHEPERGSENGWRCAPPPPDARIVPAVCRMAPDAPVPVDPETEGHPWADDHDGRDDQSHGSDDGDHGSKQPRPEPERALEPAPKLEAAPEPEPRPEPKPGSESQPEPKLEAVPEPAQDDWRDKWRAQCRCFERASGPCTLVLYPEPCPDDGKDESPRRDDKTDHHGDHDSEQPRPAPKPDIEQLPSWNTLCKEIEEHLDIRVTCRDGELAVQLPARDDGRDGDHAPGFGHDKESDAPTFRWWKRACDFEPHHSCGPWVPEQEDSSGDAPDGEHDKAFHGKFGHGHDGDHDGGYDGVHDGDHDGGHDGDGDHDGVPWWSTR